MKRKLKFHGSDLNNLNQLIVLISSSKSKTVEFVIFKKKLTGILFY